MAPSEADLPANGSGSDAASRLGGKSARMLEEEAEAEELTMAMGGGRQKKSCAAAKPAVAIEQMLIAFALTDFVGPLSKIIVSPSILAFVESNYDPSNDPPLNKPSGFFYLVNRVLSEMSCDEYIEGQEASVLFKLSTSGAPFGPWGLLKEEFGSAAFGEIAANLHNVVDVEKAAAYGFFNSTSD